MADGGVPLSWSLFSLLGAAACLLAVLSAVLERSGPIRLRHFVEEAGGQMRALAEHPRRFETFRYLLSLAARATFSAFILSLVLVMVGFGMSLSRALGLTLLIAASLALVLETINRILVGHDPEGALRRLTGLYRFSRMALMPLILVVAPLIPEAAMERQDDPNDSEASEEEIEAYLAVGAREGILEPGEEELVRGVVDFGDTQVKSVMTPRIDIISAPIDTPLDQLLVLFVESRHARVPLYRSSVDEVVGILHMRDLVRGYLSRPRPQAGELAKPAYFVPVTKPLDELLREFQDRFQEMAIVVDEYGGTAGLVTMEDLVEEIVGEIGDEHEPVGVQPLPDGSYRLEGRTHLEVVENLFDIEIEEGPYETVGGLLLSLVGEVPDRGLVAEYGELRLTVEKVSARRVERVRAEKMVMAETTEWRIEDGSGA